jgi:hypothetical protein
MPHIGKISRSQEAEMLRIEHHHHFYNRVSKVHLEVHWRLSPKLYSLHQDTATLWERAEQVDLEDRRIMGLSSEDTLILICDHATRHHWNRLAWICDVAMLLGSKSLNWDFVMDQASEWRSKRILLLGLFLANGLLGAPLPNDVHGIVANDRPVRALASEVVNHLFHDGSASVEFSSDPALRNIKYQLFHKSQREGSGLSKATFALGHDPYIGGLEIRLSARQSISVLPSN